MAKHFRRSIGLVWLCSLLLACLAVDLKLLSVRHPGVDPVTAVRLKLLALSHAVLCLHMVLANLLALSHASPPVRPVGSNLLPLRHPRLRLMTRLLALGRPLGALRTGVLTLRAHLRMLRPLGRCEALLALHARRGISAVTTLALLSLRALATAAMLLGLRLAVISTTPAMWPRVSRGRDRQRGYAGCEKNPGHN